METEEFSLGHAFKWIVSTHAISDNKIKYLFGQSERQPKLKFILLAPENHHLCVWKDQYASDNMATLNPDSNSQLNLVASCVLIGLGIYRDKLGFLNVGRYFARSRNVDSELL